MKIKVKNQLNSFVNIDEDVNVICKGCFGGDQINQHTKFGGGQFNMGAEFNGGQFNQKTKFLGSQYNCDATFNGRMYFTNNTVWKEGIWKQNDDGTFTECKIIPKN